MADTLTEQVAKIISPGSAVAYRQVILPAYCKYVWLRPAGGNAFFNWSGSDGGAVGANYFILSSGVTVQVEAGGYSSLYLASINTIQVIAFCCEVE